VHHAVGGPCVDAVEEVVVPLSTMSMPVHVDGQVVGPTRTSSASRVPWSARSSSRTTSPEAVEGHGGFRGHRSRRLPADRAGGA
jgi:hypothetical protein